MQDSLNYRHAQFGYDCTIEKKKEMLKEGGGGSPMDRPLPLSYLFNLQKAQPL